MSINDLERSNGMGMFFVRNKKWPVMGKGRGVIWYYPQRIDD